VYHPLLLEHFKNPRNAGELEQADAAVEVSNPACGDILKIWVRKEGSRVTAARFKCRGCVAAMACGSALTELLEGRDLSQAAALDIATIEREVGELPPASRHAATLALDALRALLAQLG